MSQNVYCFILKDPNLRFVDDCLTEPSDPSGARRVRVLQNLPKHQNTLIRLFFQNILFRFSDYSIIGTICLSESRHSYTWKRACCTDTSYAATARADQIHPDSSRASGVSKVFFFFLQNWDPKSLLASATTTKRTSSNHPRRQDHFKPLQTILRT